MPLKRRTAASSDDQEGIGEDYKKKRERNNKAVKKCRKIANQKAKETKERVEKLKIANTKLEGSNEEHKKHIQTLKDLLLNNTQLSPEEYEIEVKKILETPSDDEQI